MSKPIDPKQTEVLVQKYLSGQLTPGEAAQLLAELKAHPSLGGELLDHLQIDEMLSHLSQAGKVSSPLAAGDSDMAEARFRNVIPLPDRSSSWIGSLGWATALAACLALLIGLSFQWWPKSVTIETAAEESTTRAVAVLTRMVNVEWADSGDAHYTGAALSPGWLRLKAGVAQVEFYNGARVMLEGPAELQLISGKEAFCRSGKLSAEAPPSAHGFLIRTPQMSVVDLGTAFGVDINSNGAAVHVFKGEVELHEKSAVMQNLKEGEAASVANNGMIHRFLASHDAFMAVAELERASLEEQRQRHANWLAASARLNGDPSVIVHFDFESLLPYGVLLHNQATNAAAVGPGTIVGCVLGQGRWQDKKALEFSGVSSRVLLNVPGEFQSLTFAAWVRVNSLRNNYNSLFMCDAFNYGAPHWQILGDGAVRLGIANTGPETAVEYNTPVIFTPERLGQWVHLAVVYDAVTKQVTHFANGGVVKRQPLQFEVPLHLGSIQLGNWNRGDYTHDKTPIRNFNGRMDEFVFFNRPLDANEIRALYQEGSPQGSPMKVIQTALAAH
jgi:hypothetical protein